MKPSQQKKVRNQEIFVLNACGTPKEVICKTWSLSLSQLNKVLHDVNVETEEWAKSWSRNNMIQIFRFNCEKIFQEIQRLERIRNKIGDPEKEFEMTRTMINTYSQYTKLVAEGPALTRQKEVLKQAEKLLEEKR